MAVPNPLYGRVFCPESFTRDLATTFVTTSLPELQDRTYSPLEQMGEEFDTHATNNTICAFLIIGSVQHPESFLSTDIPFYCCNFCDFQTVQKGEIQKHLQIHRFGCKFCNLEVFSRVEVIRHAVKCHKAELTYEIIRYCVYSRESNGVPGNPEINLRQKPSNKKRNVECEQINNLPHKTIKLEPIDDVLKECTLQSNDVNNLHETLSATYVSNHSFSNESTRTLDQNSDENVPNNSLTSVYDGSGTTTRTHIAPQSFLRSILTSDLTGQSSPTINIISNEPGNTFQSGVKMVSLLKSPVIGQGTMNRNENQEEKINDSVDHPKVKIEVDEDSYIARLQYRPRTMSRPESNSANTESDSSQLSEPTTYKHSHIQNNLVVKNIFHSLSMSVDSSKETHSHPTTIQHTPGNYQGNQINDTASQFQENSSFSKDKDAKSLPILRTMLTKSGRLSTRHHLPTDLDEDYVPEYDDDDDEDDDDDDDEDYRPSAFHEGESRRSKNRCSPRGRKDVDEFSCVHCQGITGKFAQIKNHMFAQHHCSNLVLKDSFRNIMVYICPMDYCEYRDPRFPNFIKHLEMCGVFKRDGTMSSRAGDKRIQLFVLMTLRSLLENVQTEWQYACNICAHLFDSLADAQKHKVKKHSHCNDDKSLFKNCPETNNVGVMCLLCSTQFDVLQWPELSTQSCARHQTQGVKNNKVSETARATLKGYLSATGTDEKMSESPSNSKDQTPQLRAMLQKRPGKAYNRSHQTQDEDLPASRMLQWLIKEGSRMMHMLKE